MTSPQLENGYTRIANELLTAFYEHDFTKRQQRLLLCIVRKTYGFQKKQDDMTITQLSNETGISRPHCCTTVNELFELNVIKKTKGKRGQIIGINKKFSSWGVTNSVTVKQDQQKRAAVTKTVTPLAVTKTVTKVLPKQKQRCYQNGTSAVTKTVHTKETIQKKGFKENIKKEKITPKTDTLFENAWAIYPKRTGGNPKNSARKAWNARINSGEDPEAMYSGAKRYANFCDATGKTGSEYVKHTATFFGPDCHFNEKWEIKPIKSSKTISNSGAVAQAMKNLQRERSDNEH